VGAAIGIYGLDHLIRLFKTRVRNARIQPLPELNMTRLEVPRLNAGWRAGQHVRVRVISSGMGWFGWAESHPFTIASMGNGEDGLVLMCKKAGGWTSKLYEVRKSMNSMCNSV
jgi:ferric-chelate reductase